MFWIEQVLIQFLLNFVSRDGLNAFWRDPQNTAVVIGAFIAVCGGLLGVFLLLRGIALVSDAISHTVLFGIAVAFLLLTAVTGHADLSSPWLIVGAALAGVGTVILTEALGQSGLIKQDAALGLSFTLLFAIAIILISGYADDVHLDEDAVMVGEIGIAWANTNSHCLANCETVVITPDHPRAEVSRQCTNCRELGITPRDEGAIFQEFCANCGVYSPGQAWAAGLTAVQPTLVFWPKAVTVMGVMLLLTLLFVILFYKELKLTTFDSGLAQALGFRPMALNYGLMLMVSLVAVGAFDAVGSILVVAFFIIPAAAAYLLTDRLPLMLFLSGAIGAAGAYFGYGLASGNIFGLWQMGDLLAWLNRTLGLNMATRWDSSISASMVLMIFFFFLLAWFFSPKYGLVSTLMRRRRQNRYFDEMVALGHIYNHEGSAVELEELTAATLHTHFRWTPEKTEAVLKRLKAANLTRFAAGTVRLTENGRQQVELFRQTNLGKL
jgi:manganese/zinc/iron transport system permease protein